MFAQGDSRRLNHWPAMLDLVTATLMVFLLVTFLQTVLSAEELEALLVRSRQEHFLELFRQEFTSEIASGVIAIERNLNFLQITFSDRVLFDSGDFLLQPRGSEILHRSAEIFARCDSSSFQQIQVEGHTDDQPLRHGDQYPANNWQLSAARSISVVEFLDQEGLPAALLSANGYSSHRPVSSNSTAPGRARNRRIEIRLVFSGRNTGSLLDGGRAP